jgi:glycosyltransferase involved in cell wall biosynthesis
MKISVVTAVFNAASTIEQALTSVAGQTDADIEHVVVDGASSDGTLSILHAHRHSISILVSEPDSGIYDALNKGIVHATGDVVGFLHSDDFYAHPLVAATIATAFERTGADVIYGDLDYVQRLNPEMILRRWRSGPFSRHALSTGWMPPHPTLYVRRSLYERLGGFDTSYRIAADYEFILRMLTDRNIRVAYLPEVLVQMRTGGESNRSLSNMFRKSREDYRALRKHRVGGLTTLAMKNLRKLPQFLVR